MGRFFSEFLVIYSVDGVIKNLNFETGGKFLSADEVKKIENSTGGTVTNVIYLMQKEECGEIKQ